MGGLDGVRGVIFDMDGTLTVPALDFAAMRERLGIPAGDILAAVRSWPAERQAWAYEVIDRIEEDGRRALRLQPGAEPLMRLLESRGIEKGILTRNTRKTVDHLLLHLPFRFSAIVTREFDFVKPDPEPVLHICRRWGVAPGEVLVVGDYRDDLTCGRAAGARSCLLLNERNRAFAGLADLVVESLQQLAGLFADAGAGGGPAGGPPGQE